MGREAALTFAQEGALVVGCDFQVDAAQATVEAFTNASLVGVAVLSPVTDLTLSGATYETRATADPIFTLLQVAEPVQRHLSPNTALASRVHELIQENGLSVEMIACAHGNVMPYAQLAYVLGK
jgi:NAD(P)-dependent dehydrogenase (short-subunit alcohol dehydrogenase family)